MTPGGVGMPRSSVLTARGIMCPSLTQLWNFANDDPPSVIDYVCLQRDRECIDLLQRWPEVGFDSKAVLWVKTDGTILG